MSNFRPDTGGRRWSLVWVHLFSPAAGREGRCRQMSLACVGSTRVFPAALGLPLLRAGVCAFPSTLLRLQAALQGAGPELHALPRPTQLRFRFSGSPQRCRLGWACVLCLPIQAAQAARSLTSTLSSAAARLLPSPSLPQFPGAPVGCALCLFWGADFWL